MKSCVGWQQNAYVPKLSAEEIQRQNGKLRDISNLAERFGCTPSQLAIAWSLKNEHVHSVLIGAISTQQLFEHLHALQVLIRLLTVILETGSLTIFRVFFFLNLLRDGYLFEFRLCELIQR